MKISIIDCGLQNLGSLVNAIEVVGYESVISDDPTQAFDTDVIILPGVGNFKECMSALVKFGWADFILEQTQIHQKPLLGICLGMQLLSDSSDEGSHGCSVNGLGLISGHIRHLRDLGCSLPIPHVGWNTAEIIKEDEILYGIPNQTDFYFVHSYAYTQVSAEHILAATEYDVSIPSIIKKGNIYATQFHPEKSGKAGLRLLKNFLGNC